MRDRWIQFMRPYLTAFLRRTVVKAVGLDEKSY